MELGRRAGLDIAPVKIAKALGKTVLLVERFDRVAGTGQRRALVSALTILELNELAARWASYADLAQVIRERFTRPAESLRELTPAYDICPQLRSGGEATQAMIVGDDRDPFKLSQVAGCVQRANIYQLSKAEAKEIVDHQLATIESDWDEVCDLAELPAVERNRFWGRQFLNPFALEGAKVRRGN